MDVLMQVMPSKSKPLKKLLHFYWEICPKTNPDGKLKQEMILVWYVLPPTILTQQRDSERFTASE
jgi:vesicle coat complex subunit